jgi:hypothetical protein
MSGKKDSTRHTAPGAIADASQIERAPQVRCSAIMSEQRLYLVEKERNGGATVRGGPPSQSPPQGKGIIDRSLQERIGAILRESFADIEQEALPERLSKLIEALHREEERR